MKDKILKNSQKLFSRVVLLTILSTTSTSLLYAIEPYKRNTKANFNGRKRGQIVLFISTTGLLMFISYYIGTKNQPIKPSTDDEAIEALKDKKKNLEVQLNTSDEKYKQLKKLYASSNQSSQNQTEVLQYQEKVTQLEKEKKELSNQLIQKETELNSNKEAHQEALEVNKKAHLIEVEILNNSNNDLKALLNEKKPNDELLTKLNEKQKKVLNLQKELAVQKTAYEKLEKLKNTLQDRLCDENIDTRAVNSGLLPLLDTLGKFNRLRTQTRQDLAKNLKNTIKEKIKNPTKKAMKNKAASKKASEILFTILIASFDNANAFFKEKIGYKKNRGDIRLYRKKIADTIKNKDYIFNAHKKKLRKEVLSFKSVQSNLNLIPNIDMKELENYIYECLKISWDLALNWNSKYKITLEPKNFEPDTKEEIVSIIKNGNKTLEKCTSSGRTDDISYVVFPGVYNELTKKFLSNVYVVSK